MDATQFAGLTYREDKLMAPHTKTARAIYLYETPILSTDTNTLKKTQT